MKMVPGPHPKLRAHLLAASVALSLMLQACGVNVDSGEDTAGAATEESVERLRYTREIVFLGRVNGEPTVVPFSFRTVAGTAELERGALAWLGRGATWDRFLDETHTSSP